MSNVSLFTARAALPHGSFCRRSDDGDCLVHAGCGGDDSCCGDGQLSCDSPSGTRRRAPRVTVHLFTVRKRRRQDGAGAHGRRRQRWQPGLRSPLGDRL